MNLQPCVRIRRFPHWQRLQNVGDADKHRTGRIMLVKEISGRVGGTEEVEVILVHSQVCEGVPSIPLG